MLNDSKLDDKLWVQVVDTAVFIINRGLLKNNFNMNLYELWQGRLTNVKYFKIFGSKCYIKREDQKLDNFDSHVDEGIFIGYSRKRKAYRCYNLRKKQIVESINVTFDEECALKDNNEIVSEGLEVESVKDEEEAPEQGQSNKETTVNQEEIRNDQHDVQENFPNILKEWCQKNHPSNKIIGNINEGIRTRRIRHIHSSQHSHLSLLATFEPRNFEEDSQDEHWVAAMNEELDQIEKNDTWELVP